MAGEAEATVLQTARHTRPDLRLHWRLPDFTSYSPRNRVVKQSDAKPSPRLGDVTQALAESGSAAGSDTRYRPKPGRLGALAAPNAVMKDPRLRTSAQVV